MSEQMGAMEEDQSPIPMGASEETSKRADWDGFKKDHFVNLLVIYRKANQKNGRKKEMWPKDVWINITDEMKAKFPGSSFTTKQLKQLERDLKKKYRSMKDALRMTTSPKAQNDPKAKRPCGKVIPYFAKLDMLYQDGTAYFEKHQLSSGNNDYMAMDQTLGSPTFSHAQPIPTEEVHRHYLSTPHCNSPDFDASKSFQYSQSPIPPLFDCNEPFDELTLSPTNPNPLQYHNQMAPSTTFGGNGSSQLLVQDGVNASYQFDQFNQDQYPDAEFNKSLNLNGASSSSCPSITDCVNVYNKLPPFDGNDVFHAMEILKDSKNRALFIGYHSDNRIRWLKDQIDIKSNNASGASQPGRISSTSSCI